MKFYFVLQFLFTAFTMSAQKLAVVNKTHLLDSLKDECFYRIEIISEAPNSKIRYYFTIGRAQAGFFASCFVKIISCSDTTSKTYPRSKLEKTQLDSLRQFELKLDSFNNAVSEYPKQTFLISNQSHTNKYAMGSKIEWNSIQELILILFRVKAKQRPTMLLQNTGLDNLTSAVNQYQLWFGAGPLRFIFNQTL